MVENYDDLLWEVDEMPVQSSTPDDLFEISFNAVAECPSCWSKIHGMANYWSRDEDYSGAWLNSIDYEPCECQDDNDDWKDELDEELSNEQKP